MKGKELLLTKESIANEGIEIKVSQSDVIDALVEEQINAITSQVEEIKLSTKAILENIKAELQVCVDDAVAKAPVSKHLNIIETDHNRIYSEDKKETQLSSIDDREVRGGTIIYRKVTNHHVVLQGQAKLIVKYQGIIDGINVLGRFDTPFTFKYSKKLIKAIQEHNKRVDAFAEILPEKGINEKDIARKIKNQFTKEILKTSSPEFKQKMLDGFGINL
jgi:hypothetical protein